MELSCSASRADPMEGSEVKSASAGSPHVKQPSCDNASHVPPTEEEISLDSGDDSPEADTAAQLNGQQPTEADVQADLQTGPSAQTPSQTQTGEKVLVVDASCDSVTASKEDGTPLPSLPDGVGGASAAPTAALDEVVESSPSVLEGTIETSQKNDSPSTTHDGTVQPSTSVPEHSAESLPADAVVVTEALPSTTLETALQNSPTNSTPDSGISNGPSTPSSDTVSSPSSSSPQTKTNASVPPNSSTSSSPYDTDCSRKLMSQIQRSLSQESLLDELESELLAYHLPEGGERKGSPPINGLPTDQEGSMAVFEKCVQYKYAQQEKAIKR